MATEVETGASSRVPHPDPREVRDPEAPPQVPEAPDQNQAEIPREVMAAPRAHVTSREMRKGRETLPETMVVLPGSPVARPRVPTTETAVRPRPDVVPNTTTTTTSRDLTVDSRDRVTSRETTTIGESLPETIVVHPDPAATHLRVPKTETGVHPPPDVVPNTTISREVTAAPRVLVTSHEMTTVRGVLPETTVVLPISPVARPRVPTTETVVPPLLDIVPKLRTATHPDVMAVATKKASMLDQSIPETPPIPIFLSEDLIVAMNSLTTNVCPVLRTS